jgi:LPXTG-motif cell wall-anchored protein
MELTKETAMGIFYIAGALALIALSFVFYVSRKEDK